MGYDINITEIMEDPENLIKIPKNTLIDLDSDLPRVLEKLSK